MDYKVITAISDKLAEVLDTHDKRYMFVKIFFPSRITFLKLEGTPSNTCRNIADEVVGKCGLVKEMKEGLSKLFPKENFDHIC